MIRKIKNHWNSLQLNTQWMLCLFVPSAIAWLIIGILMHAPTWPVTSIFYLILASVAYTTDIIKQRRQ